MNIVSLLAKKYNILLSLDIYKPLLECCEQVEAFICKREEVEFLGSLGPVLVLLYTEKILHRFKLTTGEAIEEKYFHVAINFSFKVVYDEFPYPTRYQLSNYFNFNEPDQNFFKEAVSEKAFMQSMFWLCKETKLKEDIERFSEIVVLIKSSDWFDDVQRMYLFYVLQNVLFEESHFLGFFFNIKVAEECFKLTLDFSWYKRVIDLFQTFLDLTGTGLDINEKFLTDCSRRCNLKCLSVLEQDFFEKIRRSIPMLDQSSLVFRGLKIPALSGWQEACPSIGNVDMKLDGLSSDSDSLSSSVSKLVDHEEIVSGLAVYWLLHPYVDHWWNGDLWTHLRVAEPSNENALRVLAWLGENFSELLKQSLVDKLFRDSDYAQRTIDTFREREGQLISMGAEAVKQILRGGLTLSSFSVGMFNGSDERAACSVVNATPELPKKSTAPRNIVA